MEMPGSLRPELSALWQERWPLSPPLAHELKNLYPDRWVRFHSLPGSKRYAEDEAEYEILLHRHNTVLNELFAERRVYVVSASYGTAEAVGGAGESAAGHDEERAQPREGHREGRRLPRTRSPGR